MATIPVHVIHVPGTTARWKKWQGLVAAGLAVLEPAVTPAEFDVTDLVRQGRLGLLAGWRLVTGVPPVDMCVLTAATQMACLYSHARLLREQVRQRAPVFAIAEDDAVPTEAATRALPLIAAAADRLDPDWDLVCMSSWDALSHPDDARAFVALPGGGTVTLRHLRYMVGAGFQLVSLRGAEKLLPMLDHTDTHVDKVYGLAAHIGLLRVYAAENTSDTGEREPFVPLGPESRDSQLGHRGAAEAAPGAKQEDQIVAALVPARAAAAANDRAACVVTAAVACCGVAVLLAAFLATVCIKRNQRERQRK